MDVKLKDYVATKENNVKVIMCAQQLFIYELS
jgi:hypothetical protein